MLRIVPVKRTHEIQDGGAKLLTFRRRNGAVVGLIGGEPKCGKSFLGLDYAVSVDANQRRTPRPKSKQGRS